MNDLSLCNSQYEQNKQNWRLIRDLIKGESALKQHDLENLNTQSARINNLNNFKLNELYLPIPDATNCSAENLFRYAQYVQRASLFNATKRSEQGMTGMVFSRPIEAVLPASVQYLLNDADGSEVGLEQQAQEVLNDILETGREGLLVDFPARSADNPVTIQDAEKLGVRSTIVMYKAETILDWDSIKVNAASKLSFVKLAETVTKRDESNIFAMVKTKQIRVLLLNSEGNYEQRIYSDSEDEYETRNPVDANGLPFKYIPFFFIGSVNNRPNVDPAPLIEIAEVNLAHYRNSADFEESTFIVGQPMLVIAGLTDAWAEKYFADGIGAGARGAVLVPEGGSANFIQVQPNSMPADGMAIKSKQMVELGARLITDGGTAQTAEAARIKHSADASVLKVIVRNMIQAYIDAIAAVLQFQSGTEEEIVFSINTNFFTSKLSAMEIQAYVAAWQAGAFDKAEL